MEIVKGKNISSSYHKPRSRQTKSAAVQSLFTRVMRNRYTEDRLNDLLDHVSKRDELIFTGMMASYMFTKPEKPKDILDKLDDESLQRLADMLRSESKNVV